MKYSLEKIKAEFQNNEGLKFLFFWGHAPSKDNEVTKTCFSQWWESPFLKDEITYKTAEHFMMAEKARLFDDEIIRVKIIESTHPAAVKKLGRKVRNFNATIWDEHKYVIVKEANLLKFSQRSELKQFLLGTNDRIIVEASPLDTIWGIGLSESDPDVSNPNLWQGENLLGFALMEVRDELKLRL